MRDDQGASLVVGRVCEHGAEPNWWWRMLTGGGKHIAGWAGPLSKCECCDSEFGYLESGAYSGAGYSWGTRWTPRNRCGKCGGGLVEWGQKPPAPPSGVGEMERRATEKAE